VVDKTALEPLVHHHPFLLATKAAVPMRNTCNGLAQFTAPLEV